MSLQSAGLYYGNYISQEHARLAGGSMTQLLIGDNMEGACTALALTITTWDFVGQPRPQSSGFLTWLRQHIGSGRPVIVGVYTSQVGSDPDYDHIVPVSGVSGSRVRLNDLWSPGAVNVSVPAGVRSRGQCSGGSTTQPYTYCLPSQVSYGIAVTGVADPQQELYRVTLSVGR